MLLYAMLGENGGLDAPFSSWTMPSGTVTSINAGTGIIALGIVFLAFEMTKATSTGLRGIIDMVLSVFLLCGAMVVHMLFARFGSATFFILVLMQALDVIAGVIISVKVARRDIGFGG
jgi:hypothetical protein